MGHFKKAKTSPNRDLTLEVLKFDLVGNLNLMVLQMKTCSFLGFRFQPNHIFSFMEIQMGVCGFRGMNFDLVHLTRKSKVKGHFYVEVKVKLMFVIKYGGKHYFSIVKMFF